MAEIKITKKESEKYFHSSLCNGLGYMGGYGLKFDYNDKSYTEAMKPKSLYMSGYGLKFDYNDKDYN